MNRTLIAVMLAAVIQVASPMAQPRASRVALPRSESFLLASKINARAYDISVSLPLAYASGAGTRYPTVYVLDANWTFGTTAESLFLLSFGGFAPQAVVIGVVRSGVDDDPREGNTPAAERSLDLTPTRVPDEERERSQEFKRDVRTGGAPAFLRVVKEELIPEIERRYRSNGDRTLVGYSLGGLFAVYAMFQSPETFQRLILVSPSLFWDGNVTFTHESAYAASHKTLPVRIFMSVGEQETDSMRAGVRRFENVLTGRHYQGLELTTRIFEGEQHLSTFPVAVTRGLRTVFAETARQ